MAASKPVSPAKADTVTGKMRLCFHYYYYIIIINDPVSPAKPAADTPISPAKLFPPMDMVHLMYVLLTRPSPLPSYSPDGALDVRSGGVSAGVSVATHAFLSACFLQR